MIRFLMVSRCKRSSRLRFSNLWIIVRVLLVMQVVAKKSKIKKKKLESASEVPNLRYISFKETRTWPRWTREVSRTLSKSSRSQSISIALGLLYLLLTSQVHSRKPNGIMFLKC